MGRICEAAPSSRGSESAAVFIFAVALYVNAVFGEFVFDDHEAVQQNVDVRLDTPLAQVFRDDFWGNPLSDPESHQSYRPLTVLTFRWNRQLHGMHPVGFHVVNVFLHAAVCVLLLGVFRCGGINHTTSLVATLFFAAHPIHTEAVANIAGRAELLSAVPFLLSILTYLQFQRGLASRLTKTPHGSFAWLLLSIALGGVAMLCKEQGITCLGVNLILHLLYMCEGDLRRLLLVNKLRWVPVIILITGILVLVGTRLILIGGGTPSFVDSDNPASFSPNFLTRLMTYSFLCPVNFWLLLCPSQLCFDWSMGSIPLVEGLSDQRNIATLGFFICLFFLALWSAVPSYLRNTRAREVGSLPFALTLVVLPFLPASNLFFPVGFVVAERVLYLPSIGYCLVVAMGTSRILHIRCRKLVIVAVSLLLFLFSVKTLVRNREWRDTHSLAASALSTNPANAKVHFTMGNVLAQQGNRRCEQYYREAIHLRPNYTLSWTNLGLILLNTERPKEAEICYRTALRIKPDHVTANTNMGHLCRLQGRWEEALKHYRTASQRRPNNPILHYHIGCALMQLGDSDHIKEAEKELMTAVTLHPSYSEAHLALGKLLAKNHMSSHPAAMAKSQVRKAIAHIRTGLPYQKDPDSEVYLLLGKLLAADNKPKEAEKALEKALAKGDRDDKMIKEELAKVREAMRVNGGGG